jgi:DNA polymerase-3 subunit epsilon
MREIVLDTETTGLDPATGDRIVEIACVEIFNLVPTGATFHSYVDPQRHVPDEAFRVHGLSTEFLAGKPLFQAVCQPFLDFIGDSRLIIHNAEFDMKFINAELARLGAPALSHDRVFDTLLFARKKHPGASNSLDALCGRYRIDNSKRTKHGALLDSEILAELYTELMGGRQTTLSLAPAQKRSAPRIVVAADPASQGATKRDSLTPVEFAAHAEFREKLGAAAVWNKYFAE